MGFPRSALVVVGIVGNILLMGFTVHWFAKYNKHPIRGEENLKSGLKGEISPKSVIPGGHSYCSDRATARGPHQRVVSFCFYGVPHDQRLYFFGIAHNAKLLPKVYPNWTMRVYHNMKADHFTWQSIEAIERSFPHLDLCNMSSLPVLGDVAASNPVPMTWRFLPMGDPSVKEFMSRDLDLYIHPREVDAVNEWLGSNLTFHVMRDNWLQLAPILGGMWGAKRYRDPRLMKRLLEMVWKKSRERKGRFGDDQAILATVIWPYMKGKVLQHDCYFCKNYTDSGNMRPFPNQRKDGIHLGFRITQIHEYKEIPCPKECRPKDHKNWIFC